MNCTNPKTIILQQTKSVKHQRRIRVGCGQCINCKNKRAAEITNRLVDESTQHKDVCIVVLTYDESEIIYGEETKHGRYGTLWHAHVQKFIKLLRYYIKEGTEKGELTRGESKLKYYVAGEYGDDKNRPRKRTRKVPEKRG